MWSVRVRKHRVTFNRSVSSVAFTILARILTACLWVFVSRIILFFAYSLFYKFFSTLHVQYIHYEIEIWLNSTGWGISYTLLDKQNLQLTRPFVVICESIINFMVKRAVHLFNYKNKQRILKHVPHFDENCIPFADS